MCNIIQSFYSYNCNEINLFTQSCYFALSSIYAYGSDMPITLYTDYEFKEILDYAPYKNISVIFDNHDDYINIDPLVWAWPKFIALDVVDRYSIHIDGDVFLKSNDLIQLLQFNGFDAIVQHLESRLETQCYGSAYFDSFDCIKHLDFPKSVTKKVPDYMPNNGVLGVCNNKLWEKYRDSYWYMVNQIEKGSLQKEGWCVPDIIFEQYFLKELCDYYGYNIKYILKGDCIDDIIKDAANKNYQHVCSEKRQHIKKVLELIHKKDNRCYDALYSIWHDKFIEYFE